MADDTVSLDEARPTPLFVRGMAWLDEATKVFRADNPTWSDAEVRHYLCVDILVELRHRQYLDDLPLDYKPLYYLSSRRWLKLTPEQRAELDTVLVEWQAYVLELAAMIQAQARQRPEDTHA